MWRRAPALLAVAGALSAPALPAVAEDLSRAAAPPEQGASVARAGRIAAGTANGEPLFRHYAAPPFSPQREAADVVLATPARHYRFFTVGRTGRAGGWIAPADPKLLRMSPARLRARFQLPMQPDAVAMVVVPAGTRLRVGHVGPQPGAGPNDPGALQIRLMTKLPGRQFTLPRLLPGARAVTAP